MGSLVEGIILVAVWMLFAFVGFVYSLRLIFIAYHDRYWTQISEDKDKELKLIIVRDRIRSYTMHACVKFIFLAIGTIGLLRIVPFIISYGLILANIILVSNLIASSHTRKALGRMINLRGENGQTSDNQ